jgi:hypothetical protein
VQTREQGRQKGFEEGLVKQGRGLGDGSPGETSGKTKSGMSHNHSSWRNATTDVGPSQASFEAEAANAILSIAERVNERVRVQLKASERELVSVANRELIASNRSATTATMMKTKTSSVVQVYST